MKKLLKAIISNTKPETHCNLDSISKQFRRTILFGIVHKKHSIKQQRNINLGEWMNFICINTTGYSDTGWIIGVALYVITQTKSNNDASFY